MSFKKLEGTSVAEYLSRFLILKRFAPGNFASERELPPKLCPVYASLGAVVATFSCSTLAEVVMRTLECEHAHELHH